MKLILADVSQFIGLGYLKLIESSRMFLGSYYYKRDIDRMLEKDMGISLFLDSGAYSAFTRNITIDIDEYIQYIKDNQKYITQYAVLDIIGDAEGTLRNQQYMESKGLNPIPCYHYGEATEYLKNYVSNYDYIALGGLVGSGVSEQLKFFLDETWGRFLTNKDGTAKIKVHGFGMTSVPLMKRYPWYSVDSTSWVLTGRFGGVFCNIGDYNKITISNKGNLEGASHFYQLGKHSQEIIREYFAALGEGYTIEELADDYKKRDEVNILYFLELEKTLTENPVRFIQNQIGMFDQISQGRDKSHVVELEQVEPEPMGMKGQLSLF